MVYHVQSIIILLLLSIPSFGLLPPTNTLAQGIGEQAEMDRLEQQANDLAAQNDPEGAALAIGKAAMMADLLTKDSHKSAAEKIFQGTSYYFRGQELGLRALALFERTGGQPPAPAGVCHYIIQGNHKLQQAKQLLEETPVIHQEDLQKRQNDLFEKNEEWQKLLVALQQDFECSNTINE